MFGPELCMQVVLPLVVKLAEDSVFRVRKAIAANIGNVSFPSLIFNLFYLFLFIFRLIPHFTPFFWFWTDMPYCGSGGHHTTPPSCFYCSLWRWGNHFFLKIALFISYYLNYFINLCEKARVINIILDLGSTKGMRRKPRRYGRKCFANWAVLYLFFSLIFLLLSFSLIFLNFWNKIWSFFDVYCF